VTFHRSTVVDRLNTALTALKASDVGAAKEAIEPLLEAFGRNARPAETDEGAETG